MFGTSVHTRSRRRKGRVAYPPARPATVRVVVGDSFGTFVREAVLSKPWRITLVSPWLGGSELERGALDRLLRHARKNSASIFVITREPASDSHATALAAIADVPRATISFNPRVHAKLFISQEGRGRGLAVIGSGNATDSSTTLDEAGLLVRPLRGSAVIRQLALTTVHQLNGRTAIRAHRTH